MNQGKFIFSQIMGLVSHKVFNASVKRYKGDYKSKHFSCWKQFLCIAFGQLTHIESLSDTILCLHANAGKLYHLGIWQASAKSTLSNANESRDNRIFSEIAMILIKEAKSLYLNESNLEVELKKNVFAIDATVIEVCLSACSWAKDNLNFSGISSTPSENKSGVICDQIIRLNGYYTVKDFPVRMRRIKFYNAENDRQFIFLSNNFELKASEIAQLYKHRWKIELFFKWIKPHLKIQSFRGRSENAVKTQIWIAIEVYVLVAIAKKKFQLK